MSVFDAYVRLEGTLDGSVCTDEDMARHTTYHIGGPAALFVDCASIPDLALACDVLLEEKVPWVVVGKGSNLLVSDEGYKGAVLSLGNGFAACDFGEVLDRDDENPLEEGERVFVNVGAAYPLSRLVQNAYSYGLGGLEFAIGIPGTLGGAIFMNAGTRNMGIGSLVRTVTLYKPGVGLHILRGFEVEWAYRSSNLPQDEIIVEATLSLKARDKELISKRMQEKLDSRKESQPLSAHSCGSVFKNPPDQSAGILIKECGIAGASCGDAQISTQHANFIVNTGSASAQDVLALIHLARDRVKEMYGITLRPEVRFLGFSE